MFLSRTAFYDSIRSGFIYIDSPLFEIFSSHSADIFFQFLLIVSHLLLKIIEKSRDVLLKHFGVQRNSLKILSFSFNEEYFRQSSMIHTFLENKCFRKI